jgi:hypothetical protein
MSILEQKDSKLHVPDYGSRTYPVKIVDGKILIAV